MRIRVDGSLCSGHGRCYAVAPEVFAPDPEGYNELRDQDAVEVEPGLEEKARLGVSNCPEAAITALPDGPSFPDRLPNRKDNR